MRAVLALVAGCSFDPGAAPGPATGVTADARGSGSDSGMVIDAPSGPCTDSQGKGACDDQTWRCTAAQGLPQHPYFGTPNVEDALLGTTQFGGHGQKVVARAGAMLTFSFDYAWQVDCPMTSSCQAQMEIGLVAGSRQGCVKDANVNDRQIYAGQTASGAVVVPAVSGVYDVRLNIAKNASCGNQTSWAGATPDDSHTIARICVP